jgi:hypothetical protein
LRDEDGQDYGRVALSIPSSLYFGLHFDKRFGDDGLADPGVQADIARIHPYCRVKTISGKTTVGWTPPAKAVSEWVGKSVSGTPRQSDSPTHRPTHSRPGSPSSSGSPTHRPTHSRPRFRFARGTLNLAT